MIKFVLFLMLTATVSEADTTCTVQTFANDGMFLSSVKTGDKQPLSCLEAGQIAAGINKRHNNGIHPVVARVFKGE